MTTHCKKACLELEGWVPPSLKQPITIHRSTEREVLPFRHGVAISTSMNDYLPPVLAPGYMGHVPTVSYGEGGRTYGNATKKYFHNCRQEILTKSTRPKYVFGCFPTLACPLADVVRAERAIPYRELCTTPKIHPISYDRERWCVLQHFYQNAQEHRDYYLDKTEAVYPSALFNLGRPHPTSCPVDEREFKIRKRLSECDVPGYVGQMPYYNCRTLPCIQHQGFLTPYNFPKLPRPPFQCNRVKPKKPDDYDILLV